MPTPFALPNPAPGMNAQACPRMTEANRAILAFERRLKAAGYGPAEVRLSVRIAWMLYEQTGKLPRL